MYYPPPPPSSGIDLITVDVDEGITLLRVGDNNHKRLTPPPPELDYRRDLYGEEVVMLRLSTIQVLLLFLLLLLLSLMTCCLSSTTYCYC